MRVHCFISGKVQGVFFRKYTKDCANKLGINGWVKNLSDGKVELVAEGDERDIEEFLDFLKKGSPGSSVERMEVRVEKSVNEFRSFEIIY
ncbi:MAG: acylphosphatase [Candidatus Aenigmatarchaeota archaeon]